MHRFWGMVAALALAATGCTAGGGADRAAGSGTPSPSASATSGPTASPSASLSATPSRTPSPTLSPKPSRTAARTISPRPKRSTARPSRTPRTITPTRTPVFEGHRRGVAEGPDYHAILIGQNFGGNGTYNVYAKCRPGKVRITVHSDGITGPPEKAPYPFSLNISVEDSRMIYGGVVRDGQVITGTVNSRVRVMTGGINDSQFRVEYDCRNR